MKSGREKILITGGAGFIGSNLVTFLLKRGHKVVVVDDFSVGKRSNLPKEGDSFKIIEADIREKEKMKKALKGFGVVFHLATQCIRKSITNPFFVHDVNTSGTLSILEAARTNRIEKFVYVSSSEVYGTGVKVPMDENHGLFPTTLYGASKLVGEIYSLTYLRTYGIPVIVVRPFNTYGYNEHFEGVYGEVIPRFVLRALNDLPLQVFGDGKQTRDFTFVSDTVKGISLAAEKGKEGEIYNIAYGKETSIIQIANLIFQTLQKNTGIEYLPQRPGDVSRHFADTKKAKKELGFNPVVSLDQGLRQYIAWFIKTTVNPKSALSLYTEKNW